MQSLEYRPEIDGVRALAVLPVILFHLGVDWIPGGFIGVDLFFVISGYLITAIIIRSVKQEKFTFRGFWQRRIRRIFPALVVMVLATSVAGGLQLIRCDRNDLGQQGLSAIFSLANIAMWRIQGGYWGRTAEESLFLHTWSLSVEEQFYFVYPFILIALLKLGRRWTLLGVAALALSSFILYLYGSQAAPNATFYLLPTRAWELGTGCCLAILESTYGIRPSRGVSSLLALCGLTAIIVSCLAFSPANRFTGCLAVPVAGTVLIIWPRTAEVGLMQRLLSWRPLVSIGKISYSLYLWHWPIAVMGRQSLSTPDSGSSVCILLAIILFVSVISYRFVEQPVRRSECSGFPVIFACGASLCLSAVLFSVPHALDVSAFSEAIWTGRLYNVGANPAWQESDKKRMQGIVAPEPVATHQESSYLHGGLIKEYGGATPDVVVIGDSHALMWASVIDDICHKMSVTASFYAADGETPFVRMPLGTAKPGKSFHSIEERRLFDTKRLEYLEKWKPRVVLFATRWSMMSETPEAMYIFEFIGRVGARVLLLEQPPELFIGETNAVRYAALDMVPKANERQFVRTGNKQKYEKGRAVLRRLCVRYPFCSVVPVSDVFYGPDGKSCILDGTDVLYVDATHLSVAGAERCRHRIQEAIQAALLR